MNAENEENLKIVARQIVAEMCRTNGVQMLPATSKGPKAPRPRARRSSLPAAIAGAGLVIVSLGAVSLQNARYFNDAYYMGVELRRVMEGNGDSAGSSARD